MVDMKRDNYVVFIAVRGGSKSIPFKNIKPINGRPLIYWTLDAAMNCIKVDQIYVSTDSEEICKVVESYKKGAENGHKVNCISRSAETATDIASTESAMLEFAKQHAFRHIILVQATSPLLDHKQLTEAIEYYQQSNYDSLISVVRQKRFIWGESDGQFFPINYDYRNRPRRQNFDGFLVENGAFYITAKELLMESQCRISGRIGAYEMNETTYFEIDEIEDWLIVEKLLRRKNHENQSTRIKLFATDCDGILTDGGMYYTESGDEMKKFNAKDGMGFALLREAGIKTAIITGEDTAIIVDRADKIGADYLFKGIKDKLPVLKQIAKKEGIKLSEIAYMGDDLNDIQCLEAAGLGFSVLDAEEIAKSTADIIVNKRGGNGAVREAIGYLIK